ncbi:MAG: transposase [Candidatus Binatia bacterium]
MPGLIRQRVFGLALGYDAADDVGRIGGDPMFRLLLDRDPVAGDDLASQPTLLRLENAARFVDFYRMGTGLAGTVIDYHRRRLRRRRVKRITIDMDPTATENDAVQFKAKGA